VKRRTQLDPHEGGGKERRKPPRRSQFKKRSRRLEGKKKGGIDVFIKEAERGATVIFQSTSTEERKKKNPLEIDHEEWDGRPSVGGKGGGKKRACLLAEETGKEKS